MQTFRLSSNTKARGGRPSYLATNSDVARLPLEAEGAGNMGMSQLLTAIATMAVKKDLIEEILREPSQEPAPKAEGA